MCVTHCSFAILLTTCNTLFDNAALFPGSTRKYQACNTCSHLAAPGLAWPEQLIHNIMQASFTPCSDPGAFWLGLSMLSSAAGPFTFQSTCLALCCTTPTGEKASSLTPTFYYDSSCREHHLNSPAYNHPRRHYNVVTLFDTLFPFGAAGRRKCTTTGLNKQHITGLLEYQVGAHLSAGQTLVNVILGWSTVVLHGWHGGAQFFGLDASMMWRGMEVIYPMAAADECAPQLCFDSDGPKTVVK
ncbi:uncharacterized protein MYCFIDRAFT_209454 [Pseudocercospora fijiensis CIRAD86]|uniref:Uncharacterized protein n=1 Tax=Pseudocercospora fijiensis (strain CIRAD86) TaxID=383855 RepID=N1Q5N7_PSEFD|nr:uncharacterized protein MYCFIDRAFT_209454 [Pseudocercospora fijiensis CIRAD86]EME87224.1 hypothetical protein MYCFIDRAFT_209454 [Pseudocercospora fijiensis CIRAD86]